MEKIRKIRKVIKSKPTIEGAGVHLKRAFGNYQAPRFDPFLLLDDFRSNDPRHYIKGFPWHPHRGIETITYVLHGSVEHGDSMENKGVISSGDVQWMTAGSGIIHQEMPKGDNTGRMGGFQLWANLPDSHKMDAYERLNGGMPHNPPSNFMGVFTYHYASTLSSLIYTHDFRYVYTKVRGMLLFPQQDLSEHGFRLKKVQVGVSKVRR